MKGQVNMRYSRKGFACGSCVANFAIESDPATAPDRWTLTDNGKAHTVEFYEAAYVAVIPCGEACEACGASEPVAGKGMNLTWSCWTELDI